MRGSTKNDEARRRLFDCAMQGKWQEAMEVCRQQPWLQLEKITKGGDTALHMAVWDGKERVVEKMVKLVRTYPIHPEGVLKSQNEEGNTPLHLAASIGNVSMCECFTREPYDLVGICNKDGERPIFLAARHGKIEAFICLLHKSSESNLANSRNKKGETILHCAIAGGHFKLAFLIIERYKDLGSTFDQKGVSPLHLLANQPSAFRSGTRLSLIEKIIYHCIFVFPPSSGDAEKSDHPAERQTRVKLLPVLWNKIKGSTGGIIIVTFIKICINPSSVAKAEKASTDLDEETPEQVILGQGLPSIPDQGPHERNNEHENKVGLSQRPDDVRNFPVNYITCFNFIMLLSNFIMLLIKAILVILLGRSYINKIQQKKEKHVWSAKILEKLLDNEKGRWYDSTGKNPKYKDRTIPYEEENWGGDRGLDLSLQIPEMHPASENISTEGRSYRNKTQEKKEKHVWFAKFLKELLDIGNDSWYDSTGKDPPYKDRAILHGGGNLSEGRWSDSPLTISEMHPECEESSKEVQRSTDLMHKLLEEPQRSADLIHKLLELAQTYILPMAKSRCQKWHKSIEEDYVQRRLETPILVAAKNGITEMVDKILEIYPESLQDVDFGGKNAVLLAVEHRHTELYEKLVSQKPLYERAFRVVDYEGNSALHLAATLSDYQPYRFAALQMQWEIKWYKYVKNSVPQHLLSSSNKANMTPKDMFKESHKDLVEKGGQWLSSTSNSCSLVATLITTVAFATTASVPGGMKENSSRPNLEQHPGFIVFAVSSLIALSFSVTSVITFLVILTSRYHQKDFERDLPRKLLLGLTSLFISLGAMLVCFCAAHFFLLKDKLKLAAFPLYAVACVPVIFFAIMQFPFYFDLILAMFKKVPLRTPSG